MLYVVYDKIVANITLIIHNILRTITQLSVKKLFLSTARHNIINSTLSSRLKITELCVGINPTPA